MDYSRFKKTHTQQGYYENKGHLKSNDPHDWACFKRMRTKSILGSDKLKNYFTNPNLANLTATRIKCGR